MSDSAKRISDGSFKNTIKMTLTTEGHLGVGNIDPKFKVTAEGLVQGHSTISILPLVSGVGLTGKGFKVGLDAWDGDVHTQIGQVTSDGSNNGCIQVSAGGDPAGTTFGGTAYGLSLQPSGGNVGIGMTQATSRLQVNGNIRTDVDFVTGTDQPGWIYANIGTYDMRSENQTTNNWQYGPTMQHEGSVNLFDRPHFTYKIIGKTCFIDCQIRLAGSGWGLNTRGIRLLLPAALQPLVRNYYAPGGNTIGTSSSDGIGWTDANPNSKLNIIRVSIRKYLNMPGAPGFNNQWVFDIESALNNGEPVGYYADWWLNTTIRFQTHFELIP